MSSALSTDSVMDPAVRNPVLVTPDENGKLPIGMESAVLPVAWYVDGETPRGCRTIGDIYDDADRHLAIANQIVSASRRLGDAINEISDGSQAAELAPLSYDLTYQLTALAADRALRISHSGWNDYANGIMPASIHYRRRTIGNADDWRVWNKTQAYQWLVLRAITGAEDPLDFESPSLLGKIRIHLGRWRQDRMAQERGGNGLHACYLSRAAAAIETIGYRFRDVPYRVLGTAIRRDTLKRKKIHDATIDLLKPLFRQCGLGLESTTGIGRLMAALYPESRLECRARNMEKYASYFERWNVTGLVTATGHTWHDNAAFFWAQCNIRRLPTVVIQHGGQYGYDDKQPGFFSLDQTLPSHFASWGWDRYSSAFDGLPRRAKIVPMPDPRLSELKDGYVPKAITTGGIRTLLVPLSKFRSLEVRFGSVACDGRLESLRRTTAEVINRVADNFDRIIVTFRGDNFDHDPLPRIIENTGNIKVEIHNSRDMPASKIFPEATAVFWDVTATGPFESLTYGLPTVVLMRLNRWARDAAWAEDIFIETGIGGYSAEQLANSLIRFTTEPGAWAAARKKTQPVLDSFAKTDNDWQSIWRTFLEGVDAEGRGARADA